MRSVRLASYVLRYKWRYIPGFFALLGASLLVMLPPRVLQQAIDGLAHGTSPAQLARYGAIILALAVAESALRFAARHLVSGTSRLVEYDLRNDLAAQLFRLDQRFYLQAQTGDLMARCTNDLQRLRDLLGPSLMDIFRLPTMMLIGFALMVRIDLRLALISIAVFPLIALIIVLLRNAMEARFRAVQDQFGTLATRAQENLSGIRTIKAYAQEESEIATFAEANREMVRRSMSWAHFSAGLWSFFAVGAGLPVVLVLWFGGHDVVSGRITIGEFVQFIAYLALLANPVLSLSWTVNVLQQGLASWQRIREVLAAEPAIREPAQPVHLASIRGEIEFRDVTFGYDTRPILKDISLRIPAGSTVAIVGGTGAGKTTLVNLLVRLYDPWQGQITLDGVDIRQLPLEELRGAIGFVPQESFLFSEPLRDNLSYGRSNPRSEDLQYVLETSQLLNDLPQLTHGLDTVIGERGVTLSGGQKQRAALARALLKDPPILVLDDALSHVDTHTEEEILKRLRDFMKRRTTLLIAHRTSTVASADFIVVLDRGTIAEMGTHAELVARDGLYARFYRRQLLAEQLADSPSPSFQLARDGADPGSPSRQIVLGQPHSGERETAP